MKPTRREFVVAAAALATLGAPRFAVAQQASFVVPTYGGLWAKFWQEHLLPGFTASTGIAPRLDVGLGKDFVSRIRAGGDRSPYSIFMGNENIAALLRAEGFFEPFDPSRLPNAQNVFPQFVNKGMNGIRAIVSPIGLAYRTDLVKTPPNSWNDLWDNPEFKGRIGLYQVGNTAALLLLRLTGALFGSGADDFDTAFTRIKKLMPFTQASWSGEVSTALVRGDCIIAPLDWTEAMILQDKGAPVAIVAPKEGVVAFEQSFNLVKTGTEKNEAYSYLDYILDSKVQQEMARVFYTSPCHKDTVIDADMQRRTPIVGARIGEIRSYDWDGYVANGPAVTDRWNREMK